MYAKPGIPWWTSKTFPDKITVKRRVNATVIKGMHVFHGSQYVLEVY